MTSHSWHAPLPGHLMPRWGLWRRGGCHALLGPRALPAPLPGLHTVSPCGFEGWDREPQTVKLLKQRDMGFPGSLVQSVTGSRTGMHVTGRWAVCDPWEGSRTQSHPAHTGLCPACLGAPVSLSSDLRRRSGDPSPSLTAAL